MTDKLTEAIKIYSDIFDAKSEYILVEHPIQELLKAARAYNDLPVVDVRLEQETDDDPYAPIEEMLRNEGFNRCLEYFRTTYPNGLRWK